MLFVKRSLLILVKNAKSQPKCKRSTYLNFFFLGDDGKKTRTTVGYQYGKTRPTRDQLNRIMESTLRKMNGKDIDIKFAIPWRYFPRFSPQDVSDGIIWDILKIQGKYGMWYSGSSVIFESVKSVVEYNELLLRKMKPTTC